VKIEFEVKKIFSKGVPGPLSECNTIHELAACNLFISDSLIKTVYGIYWPMGRRPVFPRNSGMDEKNFWITLYLVFIKPELGKRILGVGVRQDGTCYLLSFERGRCLYYVFLSYSDGRWHSNCSVDSRPAYALWETVYLYNVQYFPLYYDNDEYLKFRMVYDGQPTESIQFTNIENIV